MNMYDVFISSKSEDYAHARQVYDLLVQAGLQVFFSEAALRRMGQADYRKAIDQALDNSVHLVLVTSCVAHVETPYVEAEWSAFVNEKRSGRKSGNLIVLTVGELAVGALPLALRQVEVIRWDSPQRQDLLHYLPGSVQEIFRIDVRMKRIFWGRRPKTHEGLIKLPERERVDGDKRGTVVKVWKSSVGEPGRCQLAVDVITRQQQAAKEARVNLDGILIEDNNGIVLYRHKTLG
jgi:hypothetical protein